MKRNAVRNVIAIVGLIAIGGFAMAPAGLAQSQRRWKSSGDDGSGQGTTNYPGQDKHAKARRYQDAEAGSSASPDSITPRRRYQPTDDWRIAERSRQVANPSRTDPPDDSDNSRSAVPEKRRDGRRSEDEPATERNRQRDGHAQPSTPPTRPRQNTNPPKPVTPDRVDNPPPVKPEITPRLETRPTRTGVEKSTSTGVVRERVEKKRDGEHIEQFTTTGRKQREDIAKPDGTVEKKFYSPTGKISREEVVRTDGSRDVHSRQLGRDGKERARETIRFDNTQKAVSKTVTKTVTINKTVNKTVVVNHYDRGRYGYVYRPAYIRPTFYFGWYDPYWYSPVGVVIYHPYRYSWGWGSYSWYRCYHGSYWSAYDVYPAPSYWVTDFVVAGYLADRYDAQISVDQAREEARAAREEAAAARRIAEQARDEAEIAEARTARLEAELRAKTAEDKAARLEREEAARKQYAGKPNPNATPIDQDAKEALKNQIEKTIAEKKEFSEESDKGWNPALPDVSKALADPQHIYPVSKVVSVTIAKDSSPAGVLSEGDLLKLEPGQEAVLKNLAENSLLKMRVMTSKGEDGEVPAGTVVNVAVKDLQDFDNEFRAKLDLALTEAAKNKDAFKQGAVKK